MSTWDASEFYLAKKKRTIYSPTLVFWSKLWRVCVYINFRFPLIFRAWLGIRPSSPTTRETKFSKDTGRCLFKGARTGYAETGLQKGEDTACWCFTCWVAVSMAFWYPYGILAEYILYWAPGAASYSGVLISHPVWYLGLSHVWTESMLMAGELHWRTAELYLVNVKKLGAAELSEGALCCGLTHSVAAYAWFLFSYLEGKHMVIRLPVMCKHKCTKYEMEFCKITEKL